jgi:hypothetical protein
MSKILLLLWIIFCATFDLIQAQASFPLDWQGEWKGSLQIYTPNGSQQTYPMTLQIMPTDSTQRWKWVLMYGEGDKQDIRNYELVVKDASKGKYVIDEKNDIILEANLFQNVLISRFAVEKNELTCTYRLENKQLIFEVMMHKITESTQTGGTASTSTKVTSFATSVYQKAVLEKKE